jgi:hypothetical protein
MDQNQTPAQETPSRVEASSANLPRWCPRARYKSRALSLPSSPPTPTPSLIAHRNTTTTPRNRTQALFPLLATCSPPPGTSPDNRPTGKCHCRAPSSFPSLVRSSAGRVADSSCLPGPRSRVSSDNPNLTILIIDLVSLIWRSPMLVSRLRDCPGGERRDGLDCAAVFLRRRAPPLPVSSPSDHPPPSARLVLVTRTS